MMLSLVARRRWGGTVALACGAFLFGCGDSGGGSGDATSQGDTMPATGAVTDDGPVGTTAAVDGSAQDTQGDPDSGGTTNPPPVCGNGIVEGIEACDDANDVNGDGCDNDCTVPFDSSIWQTTVGGAAAVRESGQGVAVGPGDEIVVAGYIVDEVSNADVFVAKYDPDGNALWTVQRDLSMGLEDRAYAVAIDDAGVIAVIGDTDVSAASSDIWLAVLTADGTETWSTTVDGPAAGNDGGRAVAFDDAGNLGCTGLVRVGDNDNDIWVAMFDAAGAELWSEIVPGPMALDDRGQGVVFDDAGALYVAGSVNNGSFNRDIWVRKYEADGTEAWTVTWDSDASADDAAFAIARSPNGNLVVAGISPLLADNQDFWVGAFEPEAGALQWWKRFGGPAITNDNAFGVAADSQDNAVAVGFKGLSAADSDIWMRKMDASSLELWTQTVHGAGMDRDEARAVAVDSQDNLIVTGEIRASMNNDGDIWVGKFAPQ